MKINLEKNKIQFSDHCIPALASGKYTIKVSHKVNSPGIKIPDANKTIQVGARRFNIEPSEINSVFPPRNSNGQFSRSLPHIVLNNPAIPWERSLNGKSRNIPWLALLLLKESEIIETSTITVKELLDDKVPSDILPELQNLSEDDGKTSCCCIKIAGELFNAIIPSIDELSFLSHCRHVGGNMDDSCMHFSVVVGNRFVVENDERLGAAGNYTAHLVSLEGCEAYLDGWNGTGKIIRLISLANWSFTCMTDGRDSFRNLAEGIVASADPGENTLKLPCELIDSFDSEAEESVIIKQYLSKGYTALRYHTMNDENTVALYRGPLIPENYLKTEKKEPFFSAADAIIYDEKAGIFDLSLSAAWQAGRMTALANQELSTKLIDIYYKINSMVDLIGRYNLHKTEDGAVLEQLVSKNYTIKRMIELLGKGNIVDTITKAASSNLVEESTVVSEQEISGQRTDLDRMSILLAMEKVREMLKGQLQKEIKDISDYVCKIRLLNDIPFYYIVPDSRMLPQESIRFFHIDKSWMEALLDGVTTIGVHAKREISCKALLLEFINEVIKPDTTGFLLRSAMVAGWPGLKIKASIKTGEEIKLARIDRLSEDVLLCLFDGVPDEVELCEPEEQFHFGTDKDGYITLRCLKDNTGEAIKPMQIFGSNESSVNKYIRDKKYEVLNIISVKEHGNDLLSDLSRIVKNNEMMSTSDFALQMITTPAKFAFTKK